MGNNANFEGLLAAHSELEVRSVWMLGANYLWSHSTNDGSTGGGEQDYPQNVACRICERASSDQDIRSSFTSSVIYQLPFGHDGKYFTRGVAGQDFGWLAIQRSGDRTHGPAPDRNHLAQRLVSAGR